MKTNPARSIKFAFLAAASLSVAVPALAASLVVPPGAMIALPSGSLGLACADLMVQGTLNLGATQVGGVGNLAIDASATLDGGSGTLTVGGNWANSGTFARGTSTVVFADGCTTSPAQISGTTGFTNLTFSSTSGRTFVLPEGGAISVAGALILAGAPGQPIQITSSTPSQPASIVLGPEGTVSNTNAQFAGNVALNTTALPRLVNIATRGRVQTGANVMIAGFIIGGDKPKKVLVTARGPSVPVLPSEVPLLMADPKMTLYSGAGPIASNDDWQTVIAPPNPALITLLAPEQIPSTQKPGNTKDAAILTTLAPGAYTAIVEGVGGTGLSIVEVFEVDLPEVPLINIATRGLVESGANVMIAGFIIQGALPRKVLVTARGQSVAVLPSEVPLLMKNPMLQLFSGATPVAENDDWQTPVTPPVGSPVVLLPSTDIPLTQRPGDVKDAAILTTLAPGAYTAIVTDSSPGIAIVEVFAQ